MKGGEGGEQKSRIFQCGTVSSNRSMCRRVAIPDLLPYSALQLAQRGVKNDENADEASTISDFDFLTEVRLQRVVRPFFLDALHVAAMPKYFWTGSPMIDFMPVYSHQPSGPCCMHP